MGSGAHHPKFPAASRNPGCRKITRRTVVVRRFYNNFLISLNQAFQSRHLIRHCHRRILGRLIFFISVRHILPAAVRQESVCPFCVIDAPCQVCHRAERHIQANHRRQRTVYVYRRRNGRTHLPCNHIPVRVCHNGLPRRVRLLVPAALYGIVAFRYRRLPV